MREQTLYEKLFFKVYNAVDYMVANYKSGDLKRNHTNYGSATAYADMLRETGHEVDLRVYGEGEFLLTDKIVIDGKEYDFFH